MNAVVHIGAWSATEAKMKMSDEAREQAIVVCMERIQAAPTSALKRQWWARMVELINGRSLEQIARLERERGLLREIARRAA